MWWCWVGAVHVDEMLDYQQPSVRGCTTAELGGGGKEEEEEEEEEEEDEEEVVVVVEEEKVRDHERITTRR